MKLFESKFKKITAVVLTCAVFFGGCSFGKEKEADNNGDTSLTEENKDNNDETEEKEPSFSISDLLGGSSSSDEEKDENKTEESNSESSSSSSVTGRPTQSGSSSGVFTPSKPSSSGSSVSSGGNKEYSVISDSSLSAQWDVVDTVADAAQDYYSENFNKTRLVSMNGYLYNYASKEIIDVEYLVREGLLSSKYLNKGCEILLLDADQMKRYDTLDIKNSESGLTVFVSVKNPKDNTKLMATNRSAGGYLTASQYASLLNSYYQNHGSIGTLYSGSDEYERIISFISMYEGVYEKYFVRSVIKDNKYSFVTLSPQTNTADIRQYILQKNGNLWEVVMSGIEKESRTSVAVNKTVPDFNLNMLPNYVISDYSNGINAYNSEIIGMLKSEGIISSESEIKYISSARNFGYVVLTNETKYLFNDLNGYWTNEQVASSGDAMRRMESLKSNSPVFIVLDS